MSSIYYCKGLIQFITVDGVKPETIEDYPIPLKNFLSFRFTVAIYKKILGYNENDLYYK